MPDRTPIRTVVGGRTRTYPITPRNCTVNGWSYSAKSAAWAGLTMGEAMLHAPDCLRVPWCHPEDQARGAPHDDCIYRVRPLRDHGRFVRVGGEWRVAYGQATQSHAAGVRVGRKDG